MAELPAKSLFSLLSSTLGEAKGETCPLGACLRPPHPPLSGGHTASQRPPAVSRASSSLSFQSEADRARARRVPFAWKSITGISAVILTRSQLSPVIVSQHKCKVLSLAAAKEALAVAPSSFPSLGAMIITPGTQTGPRRRGHRPNECV